MADLDLLLTDALLTYGSHLLYGRYGRVAPRISHMMFDTSQETIDVVDVLQQGLEANRLAEALHSLLPRHPDYARLRQALARYRQTPGAETQVRQIVLNMERWRWLPQDLGRRYILVDVPAYTLDVVERDQSVMTMRVVVGKPSWPTPVLSATMSYVVLSPDWRVPTNIAARELVPILRANPGYLAQNNMRLSYGSRDVDPRSVDWSQSEYQKFPVSPPAGTRTEKSTWHDQIYVSQPFPGVSPRYALAHAVRQARTGLQSWVHTRGKTDGPGRIRVAWGLEPGAYCGRAWATDEPHGPPGRASAHLSRVPHGAGQRGRHRAVSARYLRL